MKKLLLSLLLAVAPFASALDIATFDNTGFPSDIVNSGDKVTVMALCKTQPSIVISGPEKKIEGKMYEAGAGIYQYDFTPTTKAQYHIKVILDDEEKVVTVDVN